MVETSCGCSPGAVKYPWMNGCGIAVLIEVADDGVGGARLGSGLGGLSDLVVADIRMPPRNADDGLRAALQIRAEHPSVAVLLLSQHVQRSYATELVEQGTVGVGCVLDPEVVAMMMSRPRRDDLLERLTPRQLEVLALMAEGRSNGAIAEQLTLTTKAVARHVSHIYETLRLEPAGEDHRRVLAAVRYLVRVE